MTYKLSLTATATDIIPVVPNDSADLPVPARALRCRGDGTAGTVRLVTSTGATRDTYIDAGETLEVRAVRVLATGTTATDLEVLV